MNPEQIAREAELAVDWMRSNSHCARSYQVELMRKRFLSAITKATEAEDLMYRYHNESKFHNFVDRICYETLESYKERHDSRTAPASAEQQLSPLDLAIRFHNIYERLAPDFGYETRTETRDFNPETPNGKLMIAVCSEILKYHLAAQAQLEPQK